MDDHDAPSLVPILFEGYAVPEAIEETCFSAPRLGESPGSHHAPRSLVRHTENNASPPSLASATQYFAR
jgi:hypothetical protein